MKIGGISRNRMHDEIKKMETERKNSITNDQYVGSPFNADYGITNAPDMEEKEVFLNEFRKIEGFREEMFEPFLAINIAATMNSFADAIIKSMLLVEGGNGNEIFDAGIRAIEYYKDKIKLFSQDDLDKNPYIKMFNKAFSDEEEKESPILIRKTLKGNIFLGSNFEECGYGYSHDICINTTDIGIPVIMDKKGNVPERVSITDILLTQEAIDRACGRVLSIDGSALQYFAYMVHLKPEVDKVYITMPMRNEDIFRNKILPNFDYPEKIVVLSYKDAMSGKEYGTDFIFVRMWNELDTGIERYIPLYSTIYRSMTENTKNSFYAYMEPTIIEHIKNVIFSEILAQTGENVDFGLQASNTAINMILEKFDDYRILTPDSLRNVFSADTIKEVLKTKG